MIKKICILTLLVLCLTGCGNDVINNIDNDNMVSNEKAENLLSEDNFEWEGNIIIALTEQGAKQKEIVVPARCEGFNGPVFAATENNIETVSFESEKDIVLDGGFRSAKQLKKIELPAGLTIIDDMDFWFCTGLEKIEIPASTTTIGAYAFQNCEGLTEIVFEGGELTTISPHAFENCFELSIITLPDSLELIDEYAFYGCTALEDVNLPISLSKVGGFAFANSGLKMITVPYDTELLAYTTTSFVQADHEVTINLYADSWMDKNFEDVFSGAFVKNLID